MTLSTTVPTRIAEEASAHVARLRMQPMLERMLEHIRQAVPALQAIEVTLAPPADPGDEPRVVALAIGEGPASGYDPTQKALGLWMAQNFLPEVCRHFCLLTDYGDDHGDER